jgi:ribonuclease Z
VIVHECFFTPEQWMKIAGFPYKQAYWVTSVIHTPPEGFGKIMSTVTPRMAVAYHYWNHRDIEFEIYDGVTVLNVTKDHIEVREVTFDHEAWAQGTSREWDTAPRGEPATALMSKWLKDGELKGFNPPPREDLMKDK